MIEAIQITLVAVVVPPRSEIQTGTNSNAGVLVICIFGAELLSVVKPQTVAYSENNALIAFDNACVKQKSM